MSKEKDLLDRFGANLAESMGSGRKPRNSSPGGQQKPPSGPNRQEGVSRLRAAVEIAIDRIAPDPNQPRAEFNADSIARLAASLETHGQLQPISVRWSEDMGRYLIVAGERRWRAAVHAGRSSISAVIVDDGLSDSQILEMQLVENCIREDLQPIEQAKAFRTLMDRNGWQAMQLAEVLHLTGATISRALALLNLPCTVQEAVESGQLAPSVAYELSKAHDPAVQAEVASKAVSKGMNRTEVIEAVRIAKQGSKPSKSKGRGGKPKKAIARTMRTSGGYRITAEYRRGIDAPGLVDALREALAQAEDELRGNVEAA